MNANLQRSLMLSLALAASTCAWAEEPAQRIAEADLARWNAAVSKGSAEAIPALLAGDAMLIEPNGEASHGREAIRRFWEQVMAARAAGNYRLKLLTARREDEDTVVSRSELIGAAPVGQPAVAMTYRYQGVVQNVLKRSPDGDWRVQVQRWRGQESH